jgi:uroporphyrinogen-III synthase
MRLLVTRASGEADTLAERLKAAGHEPVVHPLTEIEWLDAGDTDWASFDAIAVTSRNALRALVRSPDRAMLSRPLIAVGPGTAALARDLGFAHVIEGPGTARQLPAFIAARGLAGASGAGAKRIVYAAGEDLAFDLAGALADLGCAVETQTVYRARPVARLDAGAARDILAGALDGVILMSPRTARLYRGLLAAHGIVPHPSIIHVCLSERVAEELRGLAVPVATPVRPDLASLLARIDRIVPDITRENAQN